MIEDLNAWADNILAKSAKPPAGYTPVAGSKRGLYRKRNGDHFDYWKVPTFADTSHKDYGKPTEWRESVLPEKKRAAVNEALRGAGFDGNGRFKSASHALSQAFAVLGVKGDIEPAETVSLQDKAKGQITVRVAMSAASKDTDPTEIKNTLLTFQYTRLENDKVEAIAYLS